MSIRKIAQCICFSLALSILTIKSVGQNKCYISGYLKGIGAGKKIYLGNKPRGIGPGFSEITFDSTLTRNDSFYFKPIKYSYVSDYSIEAEGSNGWQSFIIDTGRIFISGNADTIYKSRIIGSRNQDLFKKFYKELYIPSDNIYFDLTKRLPKGERIDSVIYNRIIDSLTIMEEIYRKKVVIFYIENVKHNPYVAIRALRMATIENIPDSILNTYFKMLTKDVQNSPPLEDIKYRLNDLKKNTQPGKIVPDFSFATTNGKKIKLYAIKSDYKLVVFWASWCAPCLAEIPILDSVYKEHKNNGLKILSVNVDNTSLLWKNNISKYTFDCIHLYQGGYSSAPMYKYFNITSIPFMILLDSKNKILKYNIQIPEIGKYLIN